MSGEDTMDLCHAEPAVHEPAILPFDHDDAFGLDAQLSDEERLVRDTAEAFAQERLQPRVTSAFLEERFDREIMSELGELGLLGATLPDRYGRAGLGYVAHGLGARAIERVASGRSEERRVGNGCVSSWRTRGPGYS